MKNKSPDVKNKLFFGSKLTFTKDKSREIFE